MNHTHQKTHTLSPIHSKHHFKPIKLTKNKTSKKLAINPIFTTMFSYNSNNINRHSKKPAAIYASSERMKLFKTEAESLTINTISNDSPNTYKLNLHKSKQDHLSTDNNNSNTIQSAKHRFPFVSSFRLNNKSKTKYLNKTSLLTQNVLLSSSPSSFNHPIPHNNKSAFKRKNKINHTTIGIPLLTNKCNEIEDNYINIQDNILLTKCKSKHEIRYNQRNKTQKELKERLNLAGNALESNFNDTDCVKVKKLDHNDILKDVLDEGVIVNEQYHEKMFLNCRYKTIRALLEMKCIDILNPMVAYQDNKNVRRHLILNEDDQYRKMLKSNVGCYKGKKGMNYKENAFWTKKRKDHSTCAEKLMKQNDEIMNMLKSTSKLKEKLYKKYDTIKNK